MQAPASWYDDILSAAVTDTGFASCCLRATEAGSWLWAPGGTPTPTQGPAVAPAVALVRG